MRLLADECCDAGLVAGLRAAGHDVRYGAEDRRGLTDDQVLQTARAEERLLLTEDKDFGDLVVRLRKPAVGVILLRIVPARMRERSERVLAVLSEHGDRMAGRYTVIHEDRVRFRRLRQPLETGRVSIVRANAHATYPARVRLVAAMNP